MNKGRFLITAALGIALAGCSDSQQKPPNQPATELGEQSTTERTHYSQTAIDWFEANPNYTEVLSPSGQFKLHIPISAEGTEQTILSAEQIATITETADHFNSWLKGMGFALTADQDGTTKIFILHDQAVSGSAAFKGEPGAYGADITLSLNEFAMGDIIQHVLVHELGHRYLMQYGPPFHDMSAGNENGQESWSTAMTMLYMMQVELNYLNKSPNYLRYYDGLYNTVCNESGCVPRTDSFAYADYGSWTIFVDAAYSRGTPGIPDIKTLLQYPFLAQSYYQMGYVNYLLAALKELAPEDHIFQSATTLEELHAIRIALHLQRNLSPDRWWYPPLEEPFSVIMPVLSPEWRSDGVYQVTLPAERNGIVDLAGLQGLYYSGTDPENIVVIVQPEGVRILRYGEAFNLPAQVRSYLIVYNTSDVPTTTNLILAPSTN
ncbi:MAG: hypothetical protein QY318_03465 [Candidatus Dojkabacteria bacterium]|nr:MAG: hypothetical protein QY318_03465 [Candidatus Dojkabacteria bacterium]